MKEDNRSKPAEESAGSMERRPDNGRPDPSFVSVLEHIAEALTDHERPNRS